MTRSASGSFLLVLGGFLVAAGGFLPPGHDRTHWVVLRESVDALLQPDEDLPFSWRQAVYYGGEVLGLGYPMAAGLAFAAGALAGRSRAATLAIFFVHSSSYAALAVAALALAIPEPGARSIDWRVSWALAGTALFMAVLLLAEVKVLRKAFSRLSADRVNFLPALFLVGLNAVLFLALARSPSWPVLVYVMGFTGSALAVGGMVLRRGSDRRSALVSQRFC